MNSNEVIEGPLTRYGYICQQLAAFVPKNSEESEEICFKAVYNACEQAAFKALEGIHNFIHDLHDINGFTVFYKLVKDGKIKAIEGILENDNLKLAVSDGKFRYLLHFAAKTNQTADAVIAYLGFGCGTTQVLNHKGKIPLYYAIKYSREHLITLLTPGATKLRPLSQFSLTYKDLLLCPLSYAVVYGSLECLDQLVKTQYFSIIFTRIKGVGNLLHLCILKNKYEMLLHLFNRYPRDCELLINERDEDERTPLMYAAMKGDVLSLNLLVEKQAGLEYQNSEGQTAVQLATQEGQKSAVRCLASRGAILENANSSEKSSLQDLVTNLGELRQKNENCIENFSLFEPENLVFAGAGIQSIAYAGILTVLEKKINCVKRVAGSSMASLIATLIALNADALTIISDTDFNSKFDHIFKPSSILATLKSTLNVSEIFEIGTVIAGCVTSGSPTPLAMKFIKSLNGITGLCHGAELLEWIEKLIFLTTHIKNCTFRELASLINSKPNSRFKHLHLFALKMEHKPRLVEFSTENQEYEDLIISEAVRACIATPGLFKPHTPKFKDKEGKFYYESTHVSYLDCCLVSNFPIQTFDQKGYIYSGISPAKRKQNEFNHKTLGFSLKLTTEDFKPDSKIETTAGLVYSICNLFYNVERALRCSSSDVHRIIDIDFTKVKFPKMWDINKELKEKSFYVVEKNLRKELGKRFIDFKDTQLEKPKSKPTNLNKLSFFIRTHRFITFVIHDIVMLLTSPSMHSNFHKAVKARKFYWVSKMEPRFKIFNLIQNQNTTAAFTLLEKERAFFEVNCQSAEFLDAIVAADQRSYLDFFKSLININQSKNYKKSLYDSAIRHGAFESLITLIQHSEEEEQLLLTNGNEISQRDDLRRLDVEGTILHLIVLDGNLAMYDVLAQAKNSTGNVIDSYINIPNDKGETPILTAFKNQKFLMAYRLFCHPKTDLCVIDPETQKTLLTTILNQSGLDFRDKRQLMFALIKHWNQIGQIATMAEKENTTTYSPFFNIPDIQTVSLLIDNGFYLEQRDGKSQKTYSYLLAESNSLKELTTFCESFKKHRPKSYPGFLNEPVVDENGIGKTALMIAAEKNNPTIVDYLINEGVSIFEKINNKTALEYSIGNSLLGQQSRKILEKAFSGETRPLTPTEIVFVMTHCSEYNYFDLAKRVVIRISAIDTSIKNAIGEGLLLIVLKSSFKKEQKTELVNLLINRGDDVNQVDQQQKTPLHHAAEINLKAVHLLIQNHEIDLNHQDHLGNTALHYAVSKSQSQITRILVEDLRLNINVANKQKRTALHLVRDHESAEFLIKKGADPDQEDSKGYKPIHYASPLVNKRLHDILKQASKR